MRTLWLRLSFLALLVVAAAPPRPDSANGVVRRAGGLVALVGADVIDGTGAAARRKCMLLLQGERILAVGPELEIPPAARVLDLTGHTILPGLIDMHGHLYSNVAGRLSNQLRPFARLFLAGGVTTVFSPGDFDPEATLAFRDAQRAGDEVGTRIFSAGPYFTNAGAADLWMNGFADADAARARLRDWADRIDGVKVYTELTRAELAALIDVADEEGLRVTGHLGSLSAHEAIDLGIDRLEHGIFAMSEFGRPDMSKAFDPAFLAGLASIDFEQGLGASLIERIVAQGVVLDPTSVIFEALFAGPLELVEGWERYLSPQAAQGEAARLQAFAKLRSRKLSKGTSTDTSAAFAELASAVLDKQRELVRRVHAAGGSIVCGTDPVFPEILPGYALQREVALLVEAGLTELEAIRACTLEAARALGLEAELGSIAPGKLADLVVVDGDPGAEITDLSRTRWVFQAGTRYSPEQLRASVEGSVR